MQNVKSFNYLQGSEQAPQERLYTFAGVPYGVETP